MIEQLQKKLTLLLSSVSIFLLLFLLGFLFFFNRNSLYRTMRNALSSAVTKPMDRFTSDSYPIYQIFMKENGEILEHSGEDFFLESDTEEKAVQDALSRIKEGKESFYGSMQGGKLQYYCKKDAPPDGKTAYRIALTDFGKEIGNIRQLSIVLFILFFALSFVIIVLSRFFVRKTVAPVKDAMLSQRQFISDASHELKTPLTVIINNVGNLQKKIENVPALQWEDAENIRENIRGIEEMSGRMKHLTESLLDLSRLESWQDRGSQLENVALSTLIEHECMYFEPLFFEKGKSLDYTVEKGLHTLGDENKLKELLSILLENALKYSLPPTATVLSLKKKRNILLLSVSNAVEKELSKEEKENLFKRFFRRDEAHSGGDGYGLGLSIAKEIVLMHKGTIKVESEKERICFHVALSEKL